MSVRRILAVSLAIAGALLTAVVADAARHEQTTRISLANLVVNGTGERFRGRVLIRTPRPAFTRTNRDAAPTAHFSARVTSTCRSIVSVSTRAVATRAGALAQARASAPGHDGSLLGSGRRNGGVWRLVEFDRIDPNTYEPTGAASLYGLAVIRLRSHRWMHVRAFADFRGSCTATDRRRGVVRDALARLLRTARVEARIISAAVR
jgi:hypothetical protein